MAQDESAPTPRRRGRPAGSTSTPRTAATPRRRRVGGAELVETLNEMVSQLIKENRTLKRQLAKLTAGGTTAVNGAAERSLRSLQRKVQRAVSATPAPRRRRASNTTSNRARTTRRRTAPATGE
jgi:hypothetical protein